MDEPIKVTLQQELIMERRSRLNKAGDMWGENVRAQGRYTRRGICLAGF
jgi:hypothetical protein